MPLDSRIGRGLRNSRLGRGCREFALWFSTLRGRLAFAQTAMVLVYLFLFANLVRLHTPTPEQRPGAAGVSTNNVLTARRGTIYDRNGTRNPLAITRTRFKCFVGPHYVPKYKREIFVGNIVSNVNARLGFAKEDLRELLADTSIKSHFLGIVDDSDAVADISANRYCRGSIWFEEFQERRYPLGNHLAQVVGAMGYAGDATERTGIIGVERLFENQLVGHPGIYDTRKDGLGREFREHRVIRSPAVDGWDIQLTIDQTIQYIAERALARSVEQHGAKSGCAIVMRVRTGEVLAMASVPLPPKDRSIDASDFEPWRNRAVAFVYEPGSTFKPLTIGTALDVGAITTNEVVDCGNGSYKFENGPLLHCRNFRGEGNVGMILKKSSNIGTAKVGVRVGPATIGKYIEAAGFGKPTGLRLPEEQPCPKRYSIRQYDLPNVCIGQSISVTPMHMASFYNTIANGGVRMRPLLVRRIYRDTGAEYAASRPFRYPKPLFRPETARMLQALLREVTAKDGTGRRARIDGYSTAGKTGTAQIFIQPEYGTDPATGKRVLLKKGYYSLTEQNSSFGGYLPADRPEITIFVMIERPAKREYGGGKAAAPVFAEIGLETMRYLNIPSESAVYAESDGPESIEWTAEILESP